MALSMHYNFTRALYNSFLLGVVVSALVILEVLPVVGTMQGGWHERHPQAPYAAVVVCVSFHFLLHVVHEKFPKDTKVFLDKACICQTDTACKLQGIRNLGVTCFFWWSLVVLDSDEYFQRLWTVYELSSFLLRPRCQILFLPVKLPLAVCLMSITTMDATFVSAINLTFDVAGIKDLPQLGSISMSRTVILVASWSPAFVLLATVHRMWAREQCGRLMRVQCFRFAEARCSSEDDRAVVEGNVAQLLVQSKYLVEGQSRTEVLDTFDAAVRMLLPHATKDRDVRPVFLF